ncbi:hypothetical protein ACEPPN_019114 [Leptodophora sp. 'Broadleaf-Isolate-01']
MLSRHGSKQPVHSVPGASPASKSAEEDEAVPPASGTCSFCQDSVFTSELLINLKAAQDAGERNVDLKYTRSTDELHQSVVDGCKWCEKLVEGISTAVHLDYWRERWERGESDGSSMNESDGEDDEDGKYEFDGEKPEGSTRSDNEDDNPGAADWEFGLKKLQEYQGSVSVEVDFIRYGASDTFSMVEVSLEMSQSEEEPQIRCVFALKGDDAVNLTFEIFAGQESEKRAVFSPFPEVYNLGSEHCYQQAQAWIQEYQEHSEFSWPDDFLPMAPEPRRLIDLSDPSKPRIAQHPEYRVPYAALSYVWGQNQTYTLTQSTLHRKQESLDIFEVPQTIKDAIDVSRRLGYQYLWVDALCIIQDDTSDMERELQAMGAIYNKSAVTIIAANATSCAAGFLKPTIPSDFFIHPFSISFSGATSQTVRLAYRSTYTSQIDPINSRAWTLQERISSTRCLFYSNSGLKWSCDSCTIDTGAPPDSPSPFPRLFRPERLDDEILQEYLRDRWLEIRAEYTSRQLTYGKDKLPAIAAMAQNIAEQTGWTYVAGLWDEFLFQDLHWKVDLHTHIFSPGMEGTIYTLAQRPVEWRAPSWSWAAVDDPIVDVGDDPREEFFFKIFLPESYRYETSFTSPGTRDAVEVEGKILWLPWKEAGKADSTDIFLLDRSPDATEYIIGEASLDALEPELQDGVEVGALAMSLVRHEGRKRNPVEGMLVLAVHDEPDGTVRRIGFFSIYSETLFDDVEPRTLGLV